MLKEADVPVRLASVAAPDTTRVEEILAEDAVSAPRPVVPAFSAFKVDDPYTTRVPVKVPEVLVKAPSDEEPAVSPARVVDPVTDRVVDNEADVADSEPAKVRSPIPSRVIAAVVPPYHLNNSEEVLVGTDIQSVFESIPSA